MVYGAETLAENHALYFWTITCRGRELSYDEAMVGYPVWTNRLLTACRAKCNRAGDYWAYVQVTEHQKKTRAHPHSHFISTYLPRGKDVGTSLADDLANAEEWFIQANKSAGLGSQARITQVRSAAAVSRYVAKYMFKAALTEEWPPNWKRIRYSQNWPKQPEKSPDAVFVLLSPQDWQNASKERVNWQCESQELYDRARHHIGNILPPNYIDRSAND